LLREIAHRRGACSGTDDHARWVVPLYYPEEEICYGKALEEALAWCRVWLIAPEIGVRPFLV
jgi:hypothetical protein